MINIIMPAYNAHKTIRQAIASVAMQDCLEDIYLTIVDDNSEESYDYLLNDFSYMNIEILKKRTNTGCGQSRQYGIDHCKCEYFMFLDADDCLYSPNAIKKILSYMNKDELDFLYTDFLEELENGDYLLHENDGVWMHGKVFKTSFIRKHGIHFNKTRVNEDHAFNIISGSVEHKSLYVDYITYVWKFNTESITRSCDSRSIHMKEFVINAKFTINEMIRLLASESRILDISKNYIINLYANYVVFKYQQKDEKYMNEYLSLISDFFWTLPFPIGEILRTDSLELYSESIYRDPVIQQLIENNVVLSPAFDNFLSLLVTGGD